MRLQLYRAAELGRMGPTEKASAPAACKKAACHSPFGRLDHVEVQQMASAQQIAAAINASC